jgi:hypothetical protein
MLRFLIGTGLLLMAVGFGAAGWQYWQGLPREEAAALTVNDPVQLAELPKDRQNWLISPSGGLVDREDVAAYLVQERYVPSRTAEVRLVAPLSSLLAENEKLPETSYLQVLADIRAPRIAEPLCAVLLATIAADCAVNKAAVVNDSLDLAAGTAGFIIELVFREKLDGTAELPDLAAHVLRHQEVSGLSETEVGGNLTVETALTLAANAAKVACDAEGVGEACRISKIVVDLTPGQGTVLQAEVAWLDPLPNGMIPAPPLSPPAGG